MKQNLFKLFLVMPVICMLILSSCKNAGDARKRPPNVKDRVQKNIEEGRGVKLFSNNQKNIGDFDFASSNELWRASLDTLEFMPLALANYSGGVIVTDWYSDSDTSNESVKISVRFLSNEVRSDALLVKVFYKSCSVQQSCKISDRSGVLWDDLANQILSNAALYEKEKKSKKKK